MANSGKIKISTIHSFKVWEAHSVILVLDENMNNEIVYTGN